MFTHEGPSEQQMAETTFAFTNIGRGYAAGVQWLRLVAGWWRGASPCCCNCTLFMWLCSRQVGGRHFTCACRRAYIPRPAAG